MWLNLNREKSDRMFYGAVFFIAIIFIGEIIISFFFREMYVDEYFSAFRSYLILKGESIPFVTGAFYYPPLVIPTYGLVQYFFGPSIYVGRVLSALFFIGLIGLVYCVGKKLGGRWAGIGAVALTFTNLLLVSNYITATMYAMTMFLLMFMVWLELREISWTKRAFFSGFMTGILFLARSNMAVIIPIYIAYLFIMNAPLRSFMLYGLTAIFVIAFGYLPIIIPNPSVALGHLLSAFFSYGFYKELPINTISMPSFMEFLEILTQFLKEYYGFVLFFLFVVISIFLDKRRALFEFLRAERLYALLLFLSFGLLGAHYFYWRFVGSVYYANYFMPLIALVITVGIAKFFNDKKYALILFAVVLGMNLGTNLYRTDLFSDPRVETDLHRLDRGAAVLRRYIPKGETILAFDNTVGHVFTADLRTFPPLVNRNFLFLAITDTEWVKRYGFYNMEMLLDWARNETNYIVMHQETWSTPYVRSPFWGKGTENVPEKLEEFKKILNDRFELIATELNVYPRKYTEGNDGGTLLLYRRKQ